MEIYWEKPNSRRQSGLVFSSICSRWASIVFWLMACNCCSWSNAFWSLSICSSRFSSWLLNHLISSWWLSSDDVLMTFDNKCHQSERNINWVGFICVFRRILLDCVGIYNIRCDQITVDQCNRSPLLYHSLSEIGTDSMIAELSRRGLDMSSMFKRPLKRRAGENRHHFNPIGAVITQPGWPLAHRKSSGQDKYRTTEIKR